MSQRPPFGRSTSVSISLALLGLALAACGGGETGDIFQGSPSGGTGVTGSGGSGASGGSGGQTTASSTSTGQGGAGQTTSTGQGGGTTGPEDCLDNFDNDGDGDVDCADSDCTTGFTCADEAPSGWQYVFTEKGGTGTPNPCADGSAPDELFYGPAGPAECSACTCGDLQGAACGLPKLTCFAGSGNCGGTAADWSGPFANGACQKPTNLLGNTGQLSCRLDGQATVTQTGSCQPSVSDFQNKETWGGKIAACGTSAGGGCGQGSACVPKTPAPTQSLCIRKDGEDACPAGFAATILGYKDGTDSRGCEPCSCQSNATCTGGMYAVLDNDNCQAPGVGNSANINVDNGTCRNVSGQLDVGSWSIQANPAMPGGSCAPSGGQPIGEVKLDGAVTFCCK